MYEKIIELINNATDYNILHTNLRFIYDSIEFTDDTLDFKKVLINYCADIVMFARSGQKISPTDNIKSKDVLIAFCRKKMEGKDIEKVS